jgi:hypothetical protein
MVVIQDKKPFSREVVKDVQTLFEVDPATLEKQGRERLAEDKDDPEGLLRLAMALWRQHALEEAVVLMKRLATVAPGWGFGHYMLSLCLGDLRRLEEGLPHAITAWQIEPKQYRGHLCQVLYGLGRWCEGEAVLHRRPGCNGRTVTVADFHVRGKSLVIVPDAFNGGDEVLFIPTQKQDGKVKAIPIYHRSGPRHDAGLGDMLQYVRYVNRLVGEGAMVTVVAQSPLASLIERSFPRAVVVEPGVVVPHFDFWARASRLHVAFGDTPETIPKEVPYLIPEPHACEVWRKWLPHENVRIGICFSGDTRIKKDTQRSIPVSMFAPLSKIPGIKFYSLQIPPENYQLQHVGFPIIDLGGQLELDAGMEDVAALISELDLIISVDTAIAHLAGALGKPTWLLLSKLYTDYRWHLGEDGSPWYPTLKIFRQASPGDWPGLISQLAKDLGRLTKLRSTKIKTSRGSSNGSAKRRHQSREGQGNPPRPVRSRAPFDG